MMLPLLQPTPIDLQAHLSEVGEEEYQQLVSLLEDDLESFALYIVRSDFDTPIRDALLERLAAELAPAPLCTVSLSYERFDVLDSLAQVNAELIGPAAIAVVGLEETPQIFATPAEIPQRPPALALLNHGREVVRQGHHPVIFWCDPTAYAALREHAPDFFDHYSGLFTFLDAAPRPIDAVLTLQPDSTLFDPSLMPNGRPRLLSGFSPRPISPTARQFYEEQVELLAAPSPERARALLGLAHTLFALPDEAFCLQIERVQSILREALAIYEEYAIVTEAARAHAMLASVINRKMRCSGLDSSDLRAEMNFHSQAALEIFSEQDYPVEWGAMQWFLAGLDEKIPRDEAALRRAISHLQAASRVFTKQTQPYFWASIHMNLGQIYSQLPYSSGNNKRAISHLQEALEVYDEATHPHEFGLVQMLLGKAYQMSAEQKDSKNERSKLLRRALSCYEAAARGFARKREHNEVALALTLAGLAWQKLPTGNKRQHLRRSADYFLQAANLLGQGGEEEMQAPHYSMAGDALLQLARLTRMSNEVLEAQNAFEAARESYERVGQKDEANKAAQMARQLDEFLQNASQHIESQSPRTPSML